MDAAYISALFGLGGATVGGLASFLTTWSTQRVQFRDRLREANHAAQIALYKDFITEASRLYGDALGHGREEVGDLVVLYALIARMQLTASPDTVAAALRVIQTVIDTYCAPNRTLAEVRDLARAGELNFLAEFGAVCRADLRDTSIRRS